MWHDTCFIHISDQVNPPLQFNPTFTAVLSCFRFFFQIGVLDLLYLLIKTVESGDWDLADMVADLKIRCSVATLYHAFGRIRSKGYCNYRRLVYMLLWRIKSCREKLTQNYLSIRITKPQTRVPIFILPVDKGSIARLQVSTSGWSFAASLFYFVNTTALCEQLWIIFMPSITT